MKKKIFALSSLVCLSLFAYAQPEPPMPVAPGVANMEPEVTLTADTTPAAPASNECSEMRFSLGLRGGMAMNVGKAEQMDKHIGGDGLFDLQYAAYWRKNTTQLGFLLGASFGYMQTGLGMPKMQLQTEVTTDNGVIRYDIQSAEMNETQQQVMMEIPIMFSLLADNGIFFNVGPRLAFPVWARSTVAFTDGSIEAYFPEEGVTVHNEQVTGKVVKELSPVDAQWNKPIMNLILGAEFGYEYRFENGNAFAIGLYGASGVCAAGKRSVAPGFVEVVPPTKEGAASIIYHSLADTNTKRLNAFDVGLKMAFHFHLEKKAPAPAEEPAL